MGANALVRFRFLHFLGQSRDDLKKIPDNAEVCDTKDGRFRVSINCDDVL